MKVSWDKLCRAAFAAAAAATLWFSSSIASACPPDAPDREGDGDDGILGEGAADASVALDPASDAIAPGGSGAVADYLQNLVATWENVTGQGLSGGVEPGDLAPVAAETATPPAESLTAKDCAESASALAIEPTDPAAEPQEAVADAADAGEVGVAAEVEPLAVAGEASDLADAADALGEAVATPDAVVAESVDADVIVGDAAVGEAKDLTGDWSLPTRAESFAFSESQQAATEEVVADESELAEEATGAELPALPATVATPEQAVPADPTAEAVVPAELTDGDSDALAVAELDAADLDRSAAEPLATNEDTTAAAAEPEAAPAEAPEAPAPVQNDAGAAAPAAPAGPEESAATAIDARRELTRLAASVWFQTVLERYHARPLEDSAVRPLYCGLTELTNWSAAAGRLADLIGRHPEAAASEGDAVAATRTDEATDVAPAGTESDVAANADEVIGF